MNSKCKICGKEEGSLFRVNHKDLGSIKLCVGYMKNEGKGRSL